MNFVFSLDQLMSKSIQVKQPELETKRISLLQNESDFLKKRAELQEKLLLELSKSQGDILKNEVNIDLHAPMCRLLNLSIAFCDRRVCYFHD